MASTAIGSTSQGSSLFGEEISPSTTPKKELGKEQFLTLLIAQLKNQDPLNPLDNTQFTAQLAQFSSLEQLVDINKNLQLTQLTEKENMRSQALNFIGKEVVSEGDKLSLAENGTSLGSFNLNEMAECDVLIYDSGGSLIRRIPLGIFNPGQHQFQWDGRDNGGNTKAAGVYSFQISAINTKGQVVPVETRITGRVEKVNLQGDEPMLYVGQIPIALSQVMDIRMPESAGVTVGTPY